MWIWIGLVALIAGMDYLVQRASNNVDPRAIVKARSAESVPNGTYKVLHTDGTYATLCRRLHNITVRHFVKMPANIRPALYQEVCVTNGIWN